MTGRLCKAKFVKTDKSRLLLMKPNGAMNKSSIFEFI